MFENVFIKERNFLCVPLNGAHLPPVVPVPQFDGLVYKKYTANHTVNTDLQRTE